jgi:hypothetical protein
MKTQLLLSTLILAIALNLSLSGYAATDPSEKSPRNDLTTPVSLVTNEIANENIQLESWMTDNAYWKLQSSLITIIEPSEKEEIQIEEWMSNDSFFRILPMTIISDNTDDLLCIEKWMTDKNYWRL